MTTYTRPLGGGTPTTGQVVKAVHVNDPIDQIYDTILAGGITADQIAVGAVDTSELATAAVTAVKMDGTLPDASEMATSAAPTTDKQLANKLYVDNSAHVGDVPTLLDSEGNAMLKAHAYRTQSAGFVTAFALGTGNAIRGFVGITNNPAGVGQEIVRNQVSLDDPCISFFVGFESGTGIFFEITITAATPTITWTPLIAGGAAPIDQD